MVSKRMKVRFSGVVHMDLWIAANRFGLAEPNFSSLKAEGARAWVLKQLQAERLSQTAPPVDWGAANFPGGSNPLVPENKLYEKMFFARLVHYSKSPVPVLERLTLFWANHFTVSARGGKIAAQFEFQAIRPNILGRFSDLCFAATTHSAMLSFLNNSMSIGPNSLGGNSGQRSLNENLGRELLELHTVGLKAGYTQADVTEMAKVLTGWRGKDGGGPGIFDARRHEPGKKTVLGQVYREAGAEEVRNVIDDLAGHPATASALALKLCKYMVGPTVRFDSDLVSSVTQTFIKTKGDLAKVYQTLFRHPDAWATPDTVSRRSLRLPDDHVIAIFRLFDFGDLLAESNRIQALLRQFKFNALLGQKYGGSPGPDGWSMSSMDWIVSDLMYSRAQFAYAMGIEAERAMSSRNQVMDPAKVIEDFLPQGYCRDSVDIIREAATPEQAYGLAFMAPEFLRRA